MKFNTAEIFDGDVVCEMRYVVVDTTNAPPKIKELVNSRTSYLFGPIEDGYEPDLSKVNERAISLGQLPLRTGSFLCVIEKDAIAEWLRSNKVVGQSEFLEFERALMNNLNEVEVLIAKRRHLFH